MKRQVVVEVDENIVNKFQMALQLADKDQDDVIEEMMREYITSQFSMVVTSMGIPERQVQSRVNQTGSVEYGKALNKIPKWAMKQTQVPYRIVRAYLQLSQGSQHVKLSDLEARCSDELNHQDVYVKTFATNYAQMKLDSEKSHGKVFEQKEVGTDSYVSLWKHVEPMILNWKEKFLELHSTDVGYVNDQNQKNLGKTEKRGTGYGQMLYQMECLDCHHIYYANGHDVFLKKCPKCQGGADTGNE